MIQRTGKNSQTIKSVVLPGNETYLIINLILAGVILLVILYSGVFSPENNNYPVACIHEKLTGEPCASCGLSHSFSLIIRGKISEAYKWNENGMRVFIFFVAQLFLRLSFSRIYIKYPDNRKQLILFDISGSIFIFLIAFMPFIIAIIKWL